MKKNNEDTIIILYFSSLTSPIYSPNIGSPCYSATSPQYSPQSPASSTISSSILSPRTHDDDFNDNGDLTDYKILALYICLLKKKEKQKLFFLVD